MSYWCQRHGFVRKIRSPQTTFINKMTEENYTMSLEQRIEQLTNAVETLTKQIASNQNEGLPAFVKNERAMAEANGSVGEAVSATPPSEPKKRGPKPKAEKEAAAASVAKPAKPIFDQLVEKVLALVEKDVARVEQIFNSFGVAKASQLKPDQHEEALNAFSSALDEVNAAGATPSYV